MKPNFILGVGCQKGGTTWLDHYLRAHPEVRMAPVKEMHIFDAVFMPELYGVFYQQALAGLQRELSKIPGEKRFDAKLNPVLAERMERLHLYHDLDEYPIYFARLAESGKDGGGDIRLVGEITPSYSALSAEQFKQIRELLNEHFNIRVVFLMRDPIDRIWSSRQMLVRKLSRMGRTDISTDVLFRDTFADDKVLVRTAYERTIEHLERAFRADELYFGFYETLFTEAEMSRLCAFLGITQVAADFDKKVNAASGAGAAEQPDPQLIEEARQFYDRTYRFCAEKFSEEFIGRLWPYYFAGVAKSAWMSAR